MQYQNFRPDPVVKLGYFITFVIAIIGFLSITAGALAFAFVLFGIASLCITLTAARKNKYPNGIPYRETTTQEAVLMFIVILFDFLIAVPILIQWNNTLFRPKESSKTVQVEDDSIAYISSDKSESIFHRLRCRDLSMNRLDAPKNDLIDKGFTPCPKCYPN